MANIIAEVTPISDKDCFYLAERHKNEFTYPLHTHNEYELNFVSNCKGVRRIIGDSIEKIEGDYDLILVGSGVEHEWQQYECTSSDIHEITVQFAPDLFAPSFLNKNHMNSLAKLLTDSKHGVAFPMDAIFRIYQKLEQMLKETNGFYQVLKLFEMLYDLSQSDYTTLASSEFAHLETSN